MRGNLQTYYNISMKHYYLKTSQKSILVLLIHLLQNVCNFKWKICYFKTYFIGFMIAWHNWHEKSNKYFAPSWSFYIIWHGLPDRNSTSWAITRTLKDIEYAPTETRSRRWTGSRSLLTFLSTLSIYRDCFILNFIKRTCFFRI